MDDYYPNNDIDEFCGILKCLDGKELAILYKVLEIDDKNENEQRICLRQLIRDNKMPLDGKIHNAYYARVLVKDPIEYVKKDAVRRLSATLKGAQAPLTTPTASGIAMPEF